MDLRLELVRLVTRKGVSVQTAAEGFGVSRKTAHKWLRRYEEQGRGGLCDQSRVPHSQPGRTSERVRKLVIEMRRKHPKWGPRKIIDALVTGGRDRASLPAVSTVGEIFRQENLVKPRRRRPPSARGEGVSATSSAPNDLWTVDYKGDFRLGNGRRCYPLTIQDHNSRFVLKVRACESTESQTARGVFRSVFQEFGVPDRILSDNGAPFAAPGHTGLSLLAVDWMKQDIRIERTRVSSPQDNGSHERMHRDLKAETTRPPCRTHRGQQHRFTLWVRERNSERPHEALGGVTPGSVYVPSEREYVARPEAWQYPGHWETAKVRTNGMMKWRTGPVFVSNAMAGEWVGLEEVEDGVWRLCYRRTQLGLLTERDRAGATTIVPNPWWTTKSRPEAEVTP